MVHQIAMQVVANSEVVRRLVARALEEQPDIALAGSSVALGKLLAAPPETPADVYLVALNDQDAELKAVRTLPAAVRRPVLVYSSFFEDRAHRDKLKASGAYEVLSRVAPASANAGYFKFWGARLAAAVRGAEAHWREQPGKSGLSPLPSNPHKLGLTGRPARALIGVAIEGAEFQPLAELLRGLNRLEGVGLVVTHRQANVAAVREAVAALNAEADYAIAVAVGGQSVNENTVLVAPDAQAVTVAKQKILLDQGGGVPAAQTFQALFAALAAQYKAKSIGAVFGDASPETEAGLAKIREAGGATFAEGVEPANASRTPNHTRLPRGLLAIALRRHAAKLL